MTVMFDSRVALFESEAVSGTQGSFVARDGCRLYSHRWTSRNAEHSAAAVVVIMHGFGEHCERYDEFASFLVGAGHLAYAFDARGHGRSPGQRGYIRYHDQFVDDMQQFLLEIRARHPSRRLVLLGHSHGGLIALRTVQSRKPVPDGLVVCSPMIALQPKFRPVPLWLADIISRLLPRLPLPAGIKAAELTHDARIVEATKRDPLGHTISTPRWFSEANHAMQRATAQFRAITLPVLILIANQDRLVDPAALERMAVAIASKDKEVLRFPEAFHEILNEVGRQQTYQRVASWLSAHFGAAVAA